MKSGAIALLLADDEEALLSLLIPVLAERENAQPRRDTSLPLVRIGRKLNIVLLPAYGTGSPAPETAKPVMAKQIPWCPERLVWVARDEMHKRQMEQAERQAFTQTVKIELMTMLAQSPKVIALRTRGGSHCADDLLVFDLPDLQVRETRVSAGMTKEALLAALEATSTYHRSKPRAETARFRSELDYIVATNLGVGITAKLKTAKAGPLRGVRCSWVQLGILATFADQQGPGGSVRWDADIVAQRGESEFLAMSLAPAPPPGSRYEAIVQNHPRVGGVATVARLDHHPLVAPVPSGPTLGDLMDVALASGDAALARLPDALRFLIRRSVFTERGSTPTAASVEAMAMAIAEGGYGTENVIALLQRLQIRASLHLDAPDGLVPADGISATTLKGLDVTPLYQALIRTVVDRWAQRLLGPLRCDAVDVVFACGGKTFTTTRYTAIQDLGWRAGGGVPLLPPSIHVGERWNVVESRVEAAVELAENSSGHRFDLLTSDRLANDPWSKLRVPGATLGNPTATLDALRRLLDTGYLEVRSGRLSLSVIGRQVMACVPDLARRPVWTVNLRSTARRAESPAVRQMLRDDLFAMLQDYRASLDASPVIVSKASWDKAPSAKPAPPGSSGGRNDERLVNDAAPADREASGVS